MTTPSPEDHNYYTRALEVMAEASNAVVEDLGSRAVSEANEATFSSALTHPEYPERRPYMEHGIRSSERPARPHDMDISDLTPGLRIVTYNDKLTDKLKFAKHEVILSEPYFKETEAGMVLYVDARRVENHGADSIPLNSEEGKRPVALSFWGITPYLDGLYNTTMYAEPYSAIPEKLRP